MRRTTMHGRVAGRDRSPAFSGPWYELRAMIVRKAADEYIDTIRGLWKSGLVIEDKRLRLKEKLELERFFYSKWYDCLEEQTGGQETAEKCCLNIYLDKEETIMGKGSGNRGNVRKAYRDPTANAAIGRVMREERRKRQKPREQRMRPGGEQDAEE